MRARRGENGVTVVELIVLVVISALCATLLASCLSGTGGSRRTLSCSNNLRYLGLAVFQYAERFGGTMPTAYENLWSQIGLFLGESVVWVPNISPSDLWRCPEDEFLTSQDPWNGTYHCSYAPNADETGAGTLDPEVEAGWSVTLKGVAIGVQYSPFSARFKGGTEQALVQQSSVATDTVLLAECWRRNMQNSLFLHKPRMRMRETSGVPHAGSRNSLLLKQYTSTETAAISSDGRLADPGPFNFLIDFAGQDGKAFDRTYHRGQINVLFADGHVEARQVREFAAGPGQGAHTDLARVADIPYWNKMED